MKVHSNEKSYICNVCRKVFGRKSSLLRHEAKYNSVELPTVKCDEYSQVFTQKVNISSNSMDVDTSHEGAVSLTTTSIEDVEKKNIVCATCNKGFSSTSNLNQHMKMHSTENLYACHICKKAFRRKSHLTRHLETYNTDEQSMQ